MKRTIRININPLRYIALLIADEFISIYNFAKHQWYIVLPAVLMLCTLVYYHNPIPPMTITVASGLKGSTLEIQAQKYREFFASNGVTLEIVQTAGASANLDALTDKRVHAALSQGGLHIPKSGNVVSLGSIGYQPLWFFYDKSHGEIDNLFRFMEGKRISIAQRGSGTRPLADDVLNLLSAEVKSKYQLLELSATDSIESLASGKIDGMFFVADLVSSNLQLLLNKPNIRFMDFADSDALMKNIKHTEKIALPAGAINIAKNIPSQDIQMIATTTILLVDKELHPAIQHLFLIASKNIQKHNSDFFSRASGFPTFIGTSEPRSSLAVKYFANGSIMLEEHLPFWIASAIHQAWFFIIATLAVIYPLVTILPTYRRTMFSIQLSMIYSEIFELYRLLETERTADELDDIIARYEVVHKKLDSTWIPRGCYETFGNILMAFVLLEDRIEIVKSSRA